MMIRCGVLAAEADEAAAIDPGPATPVETMAATRSPDPGTGDAPEGESLLSHEGKGIWAVEAASELVRDDGQRNVRPIHVKC